jgi:anti-sigma B factor antagonist
MSFVSVHAPSSEGRNGPGEQAQVGQRSAQLGERVRSSASDVRSVADAMRMQGEDAPARDSASARTVEVAGRESLAVEVQRRDDLAIVQPSGELDLATVETLRAALDGVKGAGRLVLDLRGLSFIDSTGLHLLVALHERAQDDGFQLTLLAPAAPIDRAIRLCGLDEALPFAAAVDVAGSEPRGSLLADRGRG